MQITLHNVYPWYCTHVAFKVHNDGTIPLKIWRILLGGIYYFEINEHGTTTRCRNRHYRRWAERRTYMVGRQFLTNSYIHATLQTSALT